MSATLSTYPTGQINAKMQSAYNLSGGRLCAVKPAKINALTMAKATHAAPIRVRYSQRADKRDTGPLKFYIVPPPPEAAGKVTNVASHEVPAETYDLRSSKIMRLEQNGFELVKVPSGQQICWEDDSEVQAVHKFRRSRQQTFCSHGWPASAIWVCAQVKVTYFPQVESLLKEHTGASRVQVIHHGFHRGKTAKKYASRCCAH